jgi:hypothetical protein
MVNFQQGVSSNPREVNIHVTGLISKRNVHKYKSVMHKKYKHFKDLQKEIIKVNQRIWRSYTRQRKLFQNVTTSANNSNPSQMSFIPDPIFH